MSYSSLDIEEMIRLTLNVAEGVEYETEYDGRMYTRCAFCEATLSEGEKHLDDCEMLKARECLGDIWTNRVQRIKQQQEHEKQERRRETQARAERTGNNECEHCGRVVFGGFRGLRKHQSESAKCLKHQARRQ